MVDDGGGGEGVSEIVQNSVTSFMDDPFGIKIEFLFFQNDPPIKTSTNE